MQPRPLAGAVRVAQTTEQSDEPGGGFVTCPLWILAHKGLTDCDKVVLMMLDQLAWREGDRDGTVLASNEDIASRLGKSVATIKRTLPRLAAFDPPLIALDKATSNSRDSIRLLYDRYGNAEIARRDDYRIMGQICATPVSSYQENGPPVAIGGDPDFMAQICARASAGQICATLPLNRDSDLLHLDSGGVDQICATPAEVNGTGTTVDPAIFVPPQPTDLPGLIEWIPTATDDATDVKRLRKRVPQWLRRLKVRVPDREDPVLIDWIIDAVLVSVEKNDVITYAEQRLTDWIANGGRPGVELPMPQRPGFEAISTADLPPVHPMAPPRRPAAPSSASERNAQKAERRGEMFKNLFKPKEVADGPR